MPKNGHQRHSRQGIQFPGTVAEAFKEYDPASKIGRLMQEQVLDDIAVRSRLIGPVVAAAGCG